MALKSKTITIDKGPDSGKNFLITQMPITKADRWANKALAHLLSSGFDPRTANVDLLINTLDPKQEIKIDYMGGMLELARLLGNCIGGVPYDVLQDLKDELIEECVQIIPTGGSPRKMTDLDDELESFITLDMLRFKTLQLHVDFLSLGSSQT